MIKSDNCDQTQRERYRTLTIVENHGKKEYKHNAELQRADPGT